MLARGGGRAAVVKGTGTPHARKDAMRIVLWRQEGTTRWHHVPSTQSAWSPEGLVWQDYPDRKSNCLSQRTCPRRRRSPLSNAHGLNCWRAASTAIPMGWLLTGSASSQSGCRLRWPGHARPRWGSVPGYDWDLHSAMTGLEAMLPMLGTTLLCYPVLSGQRSFEGLECDCRCRLGAYQEKCVRRPSVAAACLANSRPRTPSPHRTRAAPRRAARRDTGTPGAECRRH